MTNYSINPDKVCCYIFKLRVECLADYGHMGGKWYQTIELDMTDYFNESPTEGVKKAIKKYFKGKIPQGYTYIVLSPYSKHDVPVCIHEPTGQTNE